MALGNVADILYLRGKFPDAAKLYQQAIESEALLDPSAPGYAMYRLADLELAQGQAKKAHDLAAKAVDAICPSHGGYQSLTGAMVVVGDAFMAQGDLAGARQQYQQALETRQKLGEQDLVAESQVSLAELFLEEGHPEQAEPLLRQAISEILQTYRVLAQDRCPKSATPAGYRGAGDPHSMMGSRPVRWTVRMRTHLDVLTTLVEQPNETRAALARLGEAIRLVETLGSHHTRPKRRISAFGRRRIALLRGKVGEGARARISPRARVEGSDDDRAEMRRGRRKELQFLPNGHHEPRFAPLADHGHPA